MVLGPPNVPVNRGTRNCGGYPRGPRHHEGGSGLAEWNEVRPTDEECCKETSYRRLASGGACVSSIAIEEPYSGGAVQGPSGDSSVKLFQMDIFKANCKRKNYTL
jgi:hypothetical protein